MKLTKNIAKITAAVAGTVALGTFATATTANADSVYTVQSGDTLSSISYNFYLSNSSPNESINHFIIFAGVELIIVWAFFTQFSSVSAFTLL